MGIGNEKVFSQYIKVRRACHKRPPVRTEFGATNAAIARLGQAAGHVLVGRSNVESILEFHRCVENDNKEKLCARG